MYVCIMYAIAICMIFAIKFHIYIYFIFKCTFRQCLNRFLIVRALVGTFNKEKALVRAFSGHCDISRRFVDSSSSSLT